MSKLPDSYRVQDGCWNCRHMLRMSSPMKYAPLCLERINRQRNPTGDTTELIAAEMGICDCWEPQP